MKYKLENMILDVKRITLEDDASGELISRDEKLITAMKILVEKYPEIVTKEELIKAIWPRQIVTDWSLTRFMSDMRKLLGDEHNIKTVHGRGYRYTYPVKVLDQEDEGAQTYKHFTDSGATNAESVQSSYPDAGPSRRKFPYFSLAITLSVLLVLIGGGFYFSQLYTTLDVTRPTMEELLGAGDGKPVLAIVPVVDKGSRYETGLAMAGLLVAMFQVHEGVHVLPFSSVLNNVSNSDEPELCARLGCTDVVLLHFSSNRDNFELYFEHITQEEKYRSPVITDQDSMVALENILNALQARLPETATQISPLMFSSNSDAVLAFGEGLGALAYNDLSRAKLNLQGALNQQEDFYLANALLGNLLLHTGNYNEAKKILYAWNMENASEYESLWMNVARYRAEWYSGDLQMALMILEEVKSSSSRLSQPLYIQAILDKGIILLELEDRSQALDLFTQSMLEAKSSRDVLLYAQALYCIAEIETRLGQREKAEKHVGEANYLFEVGGLNNFRGCSKRNSSIVN